MRQLLMRAAIAVILGILLGAVVPGILLAAQENAVASAAEWEQVAARDTELAPLTISQLRAEFEKAEEAAAACRSWEARCRVTSHMADRPAETYSTLLISEAEQWLDERRQGKWEDENTAYRLLCDGQCVRSLSTGRGQKLLQIGTLSQFAEHQGVAAEAPKLPVGFPPYVLFPREHYYPLSEAFPDIRETLADPAAKVLPWRTRVDGHDCYVVERTARTESPIFNSDEEAVAWRKQNPDAKVGLVVNPNAKPGDKRIDEQTDRLAIDPRSGFMAARWARGGRFIMPGYTVKETGAEVPRIEHSAFPTEEILCTNFHEFGESGRIPETHGVPTLFTGRAGRVEARLRTARLFSRIFRPIAAIHRTSSASTRSPTTGCSIRSEESSTRQVSPRSRSPSCWRRPRRRRRLWKN